MKCLSNVVRSLALAGAVASLFAASPALGDWSLTGGHGGSSNREWSKTVNTDGESTEKVEKSEERSNAVGLQYSDKQVDGNKTTETAGGIGFNWGKSDKDSLSETTKKNKTDKKDWLSKPSKDGENRTLEEKSEQEDNASVKIERSHKVEKNFGHGEVDNGKWGKGSADFTGEVGREGSLEISKDKIEAEGKLGGNLKGHAGYEIESGKLGNENYNVALGGKAYAEAELTAEIAANLKIDKEGAELHAGGKIGASLSVGGEVSLKGELMGVPVNVTLEGKASVGAAAQAGADIEFKNGKLKITAEAGAVLGAGAEGKVTIEVGVAELAQLVKTGFLDKIFGGKDGNSANAVGNNGSAADEMFQNGPSGGDDGKKGAERFTGLKDIKIYK